MRGFLRGQSVRLVLTLLTIASSAIVIEAGQRWRP
jgi:hypothetical protein